MMTPLDDALGGNRKPNLVAVSVDSLSDSRILRASERSRRDYLLGNAHPPTRYCQRLCIGVVRILVEMID
jgi:hypothetical protein